MPLDYGLQAALEKAYIQLLSNTNRCRDVIGRAPRRHLIQKPETLLSKGGWKNDNRAGRCIYGACELLDGTWQKRHRDSGRKALSAVLELRNSFTESGNRGRIEKVT